jgi:two-component system, OmpR family, sensor histidine kinase KdpD
VRTPIATITDATTNLLESHRKGDEKAEIAYGDEIQDAAQHLIRVVDNLLDMTRLQSGPLKLNLDWYYVTDLIDQSIKRVAKELAKRDLAIDIAPDLPLVRMDFVLMQQVIVNLLHNAATYTPPGSRIRITAKTEGSDLVLSVADRGPGLPPADLERVFEKFYRIPGSNSAGTGLGLSICKGLVEAHGGTITAENRPTHGGARFTIRLPIAGTPTTLERTAAQA